VKSRFVAAVALGAAVMLGTSGCAMLAPQATTIPYSPADGLNVPENGAPLIVRNALVVTDTGATGNLIAAVVNTTGSAETLTVQVGDGSSTSLTVDVPANSVKSLGANAEPLRIDNLDAKPGSTVQVSFQSGDTAPVVAQLPVLNNDEKYYDGLVPTPAITPTDIATPGTSGATPSPTPTP
jgi:hypothetical protein